MKRTAHAVAWVALALAAFVLWPQNWGGSMTYVITTGDSMAPTWKSGDLAVLRSADDYDVGDVAAFRSEELEGTVVMHRVVEESGGEYRFQGDNNSFVDPDEVTDEQMLGRLLFRVPGLGAALRWFTKPVNLGIAAAAFVLLLSDRRSRETAGQPRAVGPPAPERLLVTAVEVPPGTMVADLRDRDDLTALARHHGRPVLEDEQRGLAYLHDGAVLYRHRSPRVQVSQMDEELRGSGRDWRYDAPALDVPRPRRQPPSSNPRHLSVAG